jgi:glycosyltransferase involved in cell wall biosynthesis
VTCVTAVQQYYVADIVPADLICYELVDECRVDTSQERMDGNSKLARSVIGPEEQLLALVDLVIASSRALQESRARSNPNTVYLPNCADYKHFARATDASLPVPDDLSRIPRPRLGYIGGVNNLIDMDLLFLLATQRPDCSIVLVGEERGTREFRSSAAYRQVKQHANVHFLGHRPYDTLPGYLRGFDVCLMPFRLNAWMQASSPNKTYQYLAAGKPIISTNFPEVREAGSVVFIAPDHARFVELIDSALQATGSVEIAARQTVARANSTEARAVSVMKHVTEALRRKLDSRKVTS